MAMYCVFVMSSIMLMKVKPDGPVYEVQFTSQLVTSSDSIATTQLQTDKSCWISASGAVSAPSVTSVTCSSRPLTSTLPPANAARGPNVDTAVSDGSHAVKPSQQSRMSALAYHHRQPLNDGRLNSNAASKTAANAICTFGSLADIKIPENFVTTGNTVHSSATDAAGFR